MEQTGSGFGIWIGLHRFPRPLGDSISRYGIHRVRWVHTLPSFTFIFQIPLSQTFLIY